MSEDEWEEDMKRHHYCLIPLIVSVVQLATCWEKRQYSSSPLSAVSLSMVLVTYGQPRYENIKWKISQIIHKF